MSHLCYVNHIWCAIALASLHHNFMHMPGSQGPMTSKFQISYEDLSVKFSHILLIKNHLCEVNHIWIVQSQSYLEYSCISIIISQFFICFMQIPMQSQLIDFQFVIKILMLSFHITSL